VCRRDTSRSTEVCGPRPAPRRGARRSQPSGRRSGRSWVRLCGSMPIMTSADPPISRDGRRWALLIPDARAAALFRATPRRNTHGPHLVSKARREVGSQFVSEDRRRSTDVTNHLAATPETQSEASLCQGACRGALKQRRGRGRSVVIGSGSDLLRSAGVQGSAGHAGLKSRPWLSSRACLVSGGRGRPGAGARRRR
jgi:hypothetical protein